MLNNVAVHFEAMHHKTMKNMLCNIRLNKIKHLNIQVTNQFFGIGWTDNINITLIRRID